MRFGFYSLGRFVPDPVSGALPSPHQPLEEVVQAAEP